MSKSSLKHSIHSIQGGLSINEDLAFADPTSGLYMIADGLGGASRGDLASQMATTLLPQFIHSTGMETETTWPFEKKEGLTLEQNFLRMALLQLNNKIVERAVHDQKMSDMGCSVVCALLLEDKAILTNIGNGRAYLYRNEHLTQLTQDASIAQHKKWVPLQAQHNLVLNFLGKDMHIDIDSSSEKTLKEGDLLILLSSGAINGLSEETAMQIIKKNTNNINSLSKELTTKGHQKNPHFDCTALILTI